MNNMTLEPKVKRSLQWNSLLFLTLLTAGGILLLHNFGGFPPTSWRLLFQTLSHIMLLWTIRKTQIALPLTILCLQSISLLIAWISLLIASYKLTLTVIMRGPTATLPTQATGSPRTKMLKRETLTTISASRDKKIGIEEAADREQSASPGVALSEIAAESNRVDDEQPAIADTLTLAVGVRSDTGKARQNMLNEDRVFAQNWQHDLNGTPVHCGLFLVADGDGTAIQGLEASRLIVQHIVDAVLPYHLSDLNDSTIVQKLIEGVQEGNMAIYYHNSQAGDPLSAAFVGALILGTTAYIVQVGNCRAYLYAQSRHFLRLLHPSTSQPDLAASDNAFLLANNHLIRMPGDLPSIEVDVLPIALHSNDVLLLCSDGLWDMVPDQHIEEVLRKEQEPALAASALLDQALQNGGYDNVSIILICLIENTAQQYHNEAQDSMQ